MLRWEIVGVLRFTQSHPNLADALVVAVSVGIILVLLLMPRKRVKILNKISQHEVDN